MKTLLLEQITLQKALDDYYAAAAAAEAAYHASQFPHSDKALREKYKDSLKPIKALWAAYEATLEPPKPPAPPEPTPQVQTLIAKFKAARIACVNAQKSQLKVRDIGGRQLTECNAKSCAEYAAVCEAYEDAAIELALAVAYHTHDGPRNH